MITFFKRKVKQPKVGVAPALRTARATIQVEMHPIIAKAKREGRNLILPCQGRTFTTQELEKEWVKGRYIWGPQWWRLSRLPEE